MPKDVKSLLKEHPNCGYCGGKRKHTGFNSKGHPIFSCTGDETHEEWIPAVVIQKPKSTR